MSQLDAERAQLEDALAGLSREDEEHRLAAATASAEQARSEERAREAVEHLDTTRLRGDALTAELMNLKVKAAADAERRESFGPRCAGSRTPAARWRSAGPVSSRRSPRPTPAPGSCAAGSRGRRWTSAGSPRTSPRCGEELAGARAEQDALAGLSRARDAEGREVRTRAEGVRATGAEAALTAREQALALSHLEEQIRERCQTELKWEVGRFHLQRPPSDEERQRLDELEVAGRADGEINLTAIEEYDELAKRYEFLTRAEGRPRARRSRTSRRPSRRSTAPRASASRRPSTW